MKKRNLTVLICLLAIFTLISVGFSAWVITSDASGKTAGNIYVDIVKDDRVTISVKILNDEKIIFGSKAHDGNPHSWLKYEESTHEDGTTLNENLSITVEIEIGSYSNLVEESALTLTFTEIEGTNYASAASANYVSELPTIILNKSDIKVYEETTEQEGHTHNYIDGKCECGKVERPIFTITSFEVVADKATIVMDINFYWGSEFNYMNPIDFYNQSAYDETLADKAYEQLKELETLLLNTISYELEIKPKTEYTE